MLGGVGKKIKEGFPKGVEVQDRTARVGADGRRRYRHSVIPGLAGGYYDELAKAGVTMQNPAEFVGAVGARLLTDAATDSTRSQYWRFNHPMALADLAAEQIIGDKIYDLNSAQRHAITLGAIGLPVSATLGTYDPTNIGELGRAKGFAQNYAEQGSEDRRQTGNPGAELIDRFFLGRRGRPLKMETAMQDIPSLTPERYRNYMNFMYNEKGPTGLGIIKGTMENLEGKPEVQIVGFPVGLESVGALAGGAGAVRGMLNKQQTKEVPLNAPRPDNLRNSTIRFTDPKSEFRTRPDGTEYMYTPPRKRQRFDTTGPRARTIAGAGVLGAGAGILAGKLANRLIATTGQSDLPTTQEYGITPERRFGYLGGTSETELVMASLRGYGPFPQLEELGLNTPEKLEQRRQELMALDS